MVAIVFVSIRQPENHRYSWMHKSGLELPHLCISIGMEIELGVQHYGRKIVGERYDTVNCIFIILMKGATILNILVSQISLSFNGISVRRPRPASSQSCKSQQMFYFYYFGLVWCGITVGCIFILLQHQLLYNCIIIIFLWFAATIVIR